jgi:hypothetical protein
MHPWSIRADGQGVNFTVLRLMALAMTVSPMKSVKMMPI